ncbi:MAG: Gfo/Idh/MocA family oxidoreductase [Anaerolineae bacterium]|nr:Gfo/Idh/MocA family oxidoreductase [Anaerolineae bacterium]
METRNQAGKVGLAVVGCGRIAAAHLPGLTRTREFELVATVDAIPERAREAARQYAFRRWYGSTEEALKDPEIEAAILLLPHDQHRGVSLQFLQAGKHVLVEKPMALNTPEADEMIATAERAGRKLMVAHVMRFMWAQRRARELVQQGAIGEPVQVIERRLDYIDAPRTPWWASGERTGGLLWMLNGSHSVDTTLWILNTRAERVYAEFRHTNPAWEGEDDFAVTLSLANGAFATLHQSWTTRLRAFDNVIIGSEATIELYGHHKLVLHTGTGATEEAPTSRADPYELQDREFARAILEDREPEASGKDVRKVMEVMDAARVSAREHRSVAL